MKILIDTNVVLDVMQMRIEHFLHSNKVFNYAIRNGIGFLCPSQIKDVVYFLGKSMKNRQQAKYAVKALAEYFSVLDMNSDDVTVALSSSVKDFEDALLVACAKRHGMDYIVTRNEADFAHSPVPALTPEQFLEITNPKG